MPATTSRLISFRGTLNLNAVFGPLSNVVTASTTSGPPPPPSITTNLLMPSGAVGVAYSQTLAATGGDGNYTWTMFNATTLIAGLVLNAATGQISGTPTAAGTNNFEVQVTSAGLTATKALQITIDATPPPPSAWPGQRTERPSPRVSWASNGSRRARRWFRGVF